MDVNNIFSGSSSTYEVLIMPLVFDSSRTFCTSVHLTKAAGTGRETWSCSAMRAAFSSRWCDPAGDPIDRRAVVKNVYDIIAAGRKPGGPATTTACRTVIHAWLIPLVSRQLLVYLFQ